MEQKRPRGRPKGTEINDGRYLDQVADLILKEPSLKKTPAITRVVVKNFPEHQHSKLERRLLRKWNKTSEERLAVARDRRDEERRSISSYDGRGVHLGDAMKAMQETVNIGKVLSSDAIGSALKAHQSISESLRFIHDSPALKALEEQRQIAKRMKDLLDPPAVRALREQQKAMRQMFGTYPFK